MTVGVAVSIFLIGIGAVLKWGVGGTASGVDVNMIGLIVMAVGGVGFLASLLLSSSMPWPNDAAGADEREAIDPDDLYAVGRRRR